MAIDTQLEKSARLEAIAANKDIAGYASSLGLDGATLAQELTDAMQAAVMDKYRRMLGRGTPRADLISGAHKKNS